jgi:hypothetical protein
VIRCGKCQWSVYIETASRTGGKHYSVVPLGAQPDFRGVWRLRTKGTETTYTVGQPQRGPAECTCPDHQQTKAHCKHIMALAVLGLVKRPRVRTAPSRAQGLKAHAKNAKVAIAEAKQLSAETRRHLAAMGPEPGSVRGTDRRAAILGMPPAHELEIDMAQRALAAAQGLEACDQGTPAGIVLPEGWQLGGSPVLPAPAPAPKALPPAPDGSFTAGFRAAVETHLAVRRGALIEGAACRYPFDPRSEGSAPLVLCGPCLDEEKGGRS